MKLGFSVKSIMKRYVLFMWLTNVIFHGLQVVYRIQFRQDSVEDAPYSGRLRSGGTKSINNKIKYIIEKDVRFTVRQLVQMTNLGLASVHFILKKILMVTKISARWICYLLTNEQKRARVQMAKQQLKKYPKYHKKYLIVS